LVIAPRSLLPYPDPLRRRRVRRSARALVACEPWPGDAASGTDVAQLALLRVLFLQRQVRRAARTRSHEAAVLLARSSLEASVLGIYCLGQADVVDRLAAANVKASIHMLGYLVDDGVLSAEVLEETLSAYREPKKGPDFWQIVEAVEKGSGGAGAISLYRRFYVPTSTFFVHANAASLLRHVRADDRLRDRPMSPWMMRSAVRVADACGGLLATAIVRQAGAEAGEFSTYAEDHLKRAFTPVAVIADKGIGRAIEWRALLPLAREVARMRRYFDSGQAERGPEAVTEARLRALFAIYTKAAFDQEESTVPPDAFDPLIDYFVEKILADLTTRLRGQGAAAAGNEATA
jgi:hypothetical protein